jgi:23S rRNA (guanosine2251-2'-O)-methyltransferase
MSFGKKKYSHKGDRSRSSKPTILKNQIWIYGKHPLTSILLNKKRTIFKILITKSNEGELNNLIDNNNLQIDKNNISLATGEEINDKFGDQKVVHQGFAVLCSTRSFISDNEFLANIKGKDLKNILILDQLTDPHNIGAIIRSAVAFHVSDIIIPKQHFHGENATMFKSSSGIMEKANIILSGNVNNLIGNLKDAGYWVAGLAGEGKGEISELSECKNICLIVGNEGDGIRQLVKKNCDLLLKIPISSDVESLNASNATTIALYEMSKNKN